MNPLSLLGAMNPLNIFADAMQSLGGALQGSQGGEEAGAAAQRGPLSFDPFSQQQGDSSSLTGITY